MWYLAEESNSYYSSMVLTNHVNCPVAAGPEWTQGDRWGGCCPPSLFMDSVLANSSPCCNLFAALQSTLAGLLGSFTDMHRVGKNSSMCPTGVEAGDTASLLQLSGCKHVSSSGTVRCHVFHISVPCVCDVTIENNPQAECSCAVWCV